jgi:predicted nucleic acid-binding Zn ribbon protein
VPARASQATRLSTSSGSGDELALPYEDDDETDLDESELPDPSDMDTDDDEPEVGDPCPFCKKPIYEDADRCPYCGNFIASQSPTRSNSTWIIVCVIVCLIAVLIVWLR